MKKMILIALGATLIASCNKTYTCIDNKTEIVTGEVKARTQEKANSLCPDGTTAKPK